MDSEKWEVATDAYVYGGSVVGSLTLPPFVHEKSFFAFGTSQRTPETIRTNFSHIVPDTMGAAGPSHYMQLVNRNAAIFNKSTGALIEQMSASLFMTGQEGIGMTDPRVVYDFSWQRWVACMMESDSKLIRITVSNGSNPEQLTNWSRFTVDVSVQGSNFFKDFPTMGLDGNGIYIVVRMTISEPFNPTQWRQAIIPIKKPSGGGPISASDIKPTVYIDMNQGYSRRWVYPVMSYYNGSSPTYGWLLSKGDSSQSRDIEYRKMWWTGDQFNVDAAWTTIDIPDSYYDLDNNYSFAVPQRPPQQGEIGTQTPNVLVGSRLQMASLHGSYIYTCNHIGLDGGSNSTYEGGAVDRMAVQWVRLGIGANSLSLSGYGRIYDTATSSPYYYFVPSIAANGQGDMVLGFSCARATEYIGAVFWGRSGYSQIFSKKPVLIQAGRGYFDNIRWGDYSATTLDPAQSANFWSIQEFSEPQESVYTYKYGLWVNKIKSTVESP